MITHFVGCLHKAEAMQSLGWWHLQADDVAAAVGSVTVGTRPMGAVPPALLPLVRGARPRLVALDGAAFQRPAGGPRDFLEFHSTNRARLAIVAARVNRAAVEPPVDCRGAFVHRRAGDYKGIRQTPGWPWPFDHGVGVLMGPCHQQRPADHPKGLCCHPVYGPKVREHWQPSRVAAVHNRVLEETAKRLGPVAMRALATGTAGGGVVRVSVASLVSNATGRGANPGEAVVLDEAKVAAAVKDTDAAIVVLVLDVEGNVLPPLGGAGRSSVCALLREACRVYYRDYPRLSPPAADV